MLEHEHKGIFSLNLKKLTNPVDDLKLILVLLNEMLLMMLVCKLVLKQREDLSRYGEIINNFLLGTVCSTTFCENCLFKIIIITIIISIVIIIVIIVIIIIIIIIII